MRYIFPAIFLFVLHVNCLFAQIISGPMLGPVELRDAKIWVEVSQSVKTVSVQFNKKGTAKKTSVQYRGTLGNAFNPVQFTIGGLDLNTTYEYVVLADGRPTTAKGEFKTKDLWQWRKPAPDFSFLTGSCAYFNEPVFDRPGRPYGGDSSIFKSMGREEADFMLWLGDNWYTREVDYYSEWGLWYRAHHDRKMPILQSLLKAMPHYATWDDHDYGPNNMGKHYVLKENSRDVFMNYWANPSYGENGEGIYTMFSYSDVDFFLLDDRWWRSEDGVPDSVNNRPNQAKTMFGAQQMEWLKNALLYSRAPFKFIVTGTQVLNPVSPYDKMLDFSYEYKELMDFLKDRKIPGVLFLTGDRHHSEIIKVDRQGTYPLFDITVSPLTSGTHVFGDPEKNNPYRVFALDQKQNYGRISVSGKRNERKLTVEFLGINGGSLGEWSIMESQLK